MTIAALVIAVAALAASAASIVTTRWFLRRLLAALSAPPQFTRTLTAAEERKLREDFDAFIVRNIRRTR